MCADVERHRRHTGSALQPAHVGILSPFRAEKCPSDDTCALRCRHPSTGGRRALHLRLQYSLQPSWDIARNSCYRKVTPKKGALICCKRGKVARLLYVERRK